MVGPDDYETLPTNNHAIHMTAGAIAGVMEHCVMYPLDSVKTRMQSLTPSLSYRGIYDTLHGMIKHEGVLRPVRGMGCVVAGAGPAHALYFACFEHLKTTLHADTSQYPYFISGVAGSIATILHDAVMTPSEVVKQRIQMVDSPYKGIVDCARQIYGAEGIRAFYRSYTTQLAMNVPFQSIHFMMYDLCQHITNPERRYNPPMHMVSGAIAGAFAAAVTTPLDVVKTLLNTQQHKVSGMMSALKAVYRIGGPSGFFRGARARVLYQMPSTAICWSTYEFFKFILKKNRAEKAERDFSSKMPNLLLPEVTMETEMPKTENLLEWSDNMYRAPINSLYLTDSYEYARRDTSS